MDISRSEVEWVWSDNEWVWSVWSHVMPLGPTQLKAVLQTVEYFERYKLNRKYLKYHPSKVLQEDKKAWWRYAITAVLEEDVKRRTRMWSWKHIRQHRYVPM